MRWLKSARHAIRGFSEVFKTERNFRLEVLAGLLAGILSFVFPLSAAEKVAQRRSLELGEEIIEETGEMCTGCCGPIVRKIKVKSDGSTCEETVECKSCGTPFHHGPVNCPD